ncbi:MAG: DUF1043 family protein [Gammaproteobacteria bacterium]|nr:DUF1043 family protein [Gammaproteobacteria bacterium]
MEFLSSQSPLVVAALAAIAGFFIGIGVMMMLDRRKAGGKSVDQLREEFDDYREKVASHFGETSELFRDMTEKYRDVYNHLAAGSQSLCEDPIQHGRLEFIDRQQIDNAVPEKDADGANTEATPDKPVTAEKAH